jgi:phosphoglycerate dehydrogenase-like enzyme
VVFRKPFASPDELVRALADFEIVSAMRERTPFPRSVLERLPRLKLLVTTGTWNAAIDVKAALERDVVVCGTPSSHHAAMELAFALLICAARQIHVEHQSVREGGWQVGVGGDLNGRTLGVLGLGRIGGEIARHGRAFGMNVIAWSQNLTEERARECGGRRVDKAELFSQSDYITIHLKLSERTHGLVGASELARMKPTAYLVNTSRGPIVDEAALVAALRQGTIAGAGLDVYDEEPLPLDHPLRNLPNTVITPHLGYVTEEGYRIFYGQALEDVKAWLAGQPVRVLRP